MSLPASISLPEFVLNGATTREVRGPDALTLDCRSGALLYVTDDGLLEKMPGARCDNECANAHTPCTFGLTVFELTDGRRILVCTEIAENQGKSVTNSWPVLATALLSALGGNPDATTFIEHYFSGSYRRHEPCGESFDEVSLAWESGVATGQTWRAIQNSRRSTLGRGM